MNVQKSRPEFLEVVAKATSAANDLLKPNLSKVFDKLGVHADENDIPACHQNDRTITKFSNRKETLQILLVKNDLKSLDLYELDFFDATKTFINESVCSFYRGLLNK